MTTAEYWPEPEGLDDLTENWIALVIYDQQTRSNTPVPRHERPWFSVAVAWGLKLGIENVYLDDTDRSATIYIRDSALAGRADLED